MNFPKYGENIRLIFNYILGTLLLILPVWKGEPLDPAGNGLSRQDQGLLTGKTGEKDEGYW